MLYQIAIAGAVLDDLRRDKTLPQEFALVDLSAEHVHWDGEMDRSGSPGHRRGERCVEFVLQRLDMPDHAGILGHRCGHAHLIQFLEMVHAAREPRAAPADQQHRTAIPERVGQAGQCIGMSRAAAHGHHTQPSGHPSPRIGHVRGRLFVADVDDLDAGIDACIQ